ncbi:sulfite exporter TauE/SafE family protein [Croceiramulus getboli]|nr:sulfite exporter TauE/SafE family protein [Flavobacteriaceae bacterium YJPT1-3]
MEMDGLLASVFFGLGVAAFTLSTISGGGGALLLIPFTNLFVGQSQAAPILNLGTFIGRPARLLLFWKSIRWDIFWYYVPAAALGAVVAAYFFARIQVPLLQILIGVFLISTLVQYRFGKKERSFPVEKWYFIPLGLFISGVGTITGGMGPILNPFYLNMGVTKEALIATKTANSFFVGLIQIGSYSFFGLLSGALWGYGTALGLGAIVGNILGKQLLKSMKPITFRRWVIAIMVVSGLLLLFQGVQSYLS